MGKKKKVSIWTGVASLVIGSAVAAVIYSKYKKHKEENSYFEGVTQEDIAWG